jgi:hypothetical protein
MHVLATPGGPLTTGKEADPEFAASYLELLLLLFCGS